MMELSYQSMKIANEAREAEELRTEMRKKSLLTLIYQYLMGQSYVTAAVALDQETNGGVRKFEVCDNIDLEMVLMEYESYYYIKFQKYPKLIRRTGDTGEHRYAKSGGIKRCTSSAVKHLPKINQNPVSGNGAKKTPTNSHTNENGSSAPPEIGINISSLRNGVAGEATVNRNVQKDLLRKDLFTSFPLKPQKMDNKGSIPDAVKGCGNDSEHMERLLKPLSGFSGVSSEMRELAAIISRDIHLDSPNVRWEDIIGLEDAKRLVKEAVVYPIKYPQLFTGILSPWKGLLLYGPPGTGKTLLAKAVATECKTTFFNISASSIVSKWRGDSEKLVRVLFELARYHAPSTIFLDELESVMSQRGTSTGGEHEGSRRMKTELLVQMDGLARSEDLVFVLAASNLPWELDHAMLRRLEKRILVGLPSLPARQAMISHWLPPLTSSGGVELRTDLDYETLAEGIKGYSGSDIKLVCKEAAMRPVRKVFDALESHQHGRTTHVIGAAAAIVLASLGLVFAGAAEMPAIHLETVTTADFLQVIAHTKPSARNLMDKYAAWEREYESV